MRWLVAPLAWTLLLGCGESTDDAPPAPDAGTADAGPIGDAGFAYEITVRPPTPPDAPSEPDLAPCPTGWREVARPDAPNLCDPWPASGHQRCGPGEAHFAGTPGCARIGTPCPAGEFITAIPGGRSALYVRASSTAPGGDGSLGSPFTSINQAIATAAPGDAVVLGKGRFDEAVRLDKNVLLLGSCVEETMVVTATRSDDEAVIEISSDAAFSNLTIGGGSRMGIRVTAGRLEASSFAVVGARKVGLRVEGGEAIVENLLIRGTTAAPDGGFGFGRGIHVLGGGRVEVTNALLLENREIGIAVRDPTATPSRFADVAVIETQLQAPFDTGRGVNLSEMSDVSFDRVVIEANHDVGLAMSYGARLDVRDMVIRDTRPNSSGVFGVGMAVNANAEVMGARVYIGGSRTAGLAIGSDPNELASVRLSDLVVEDTSGDDAGEFGRGVEVGYGADAELERAWLRNNRVHGLFVDGPGSTLIASDVSVIETHPKASDGTSGWGASATEGALLELTRGLLSMNSNTGASFDGDGTIVRLLDVAVEDVVGPCGRGLNAQNGAHLEVTRGSIARNGEVGLVAHDPDTLVELTDVRIEQTRPTASGLLGRGAGAQLGAQLTLTRVAIVENRESGLFAHDDGTVVTLTDVLLKDTESQEVTGTFGRGLNVQGGAIVSGSRVRFENNREGALVVQQADSSVALADVAVIGTRQRTCATSGCAGQGAGSGIIVRAGAAAAIERFLIAENFVTGVQLFDGGTIDLDDGDIVGHPVGVNVQTTGFDEGRVRTGVRYVDNDIAVNGAGLFVPTEEASPIPE